MYMDLHSNMIHKMFQQNPFMIQVNDEDGKGVKFKGYCIDLIEEIRKLIGFEYEIYTAPDNNFGNVEVDIYFIVIL